MRARMVAALIAWMLCPGQRPLDAEEPPSPEALVLFGNGVWTAEGGAYDDTRALRHKFKDKHFPLLTDTAFDLAYPFDYSYNKTACVDDPPKPFRDLNCFIDLLETLQQAAQAGGFEFSHKDFWRFVLGLPVGPPGLFDLFANSLQATVLAFNPLAITAEDLSEQVETYRSTIDGGTKVLLVAHSQGNFFGNQSYTLLSPTQQRSFGMVSVATPAGSVAGDGPHTTLFQDFIRFFPGALSPNTSHLLCGNPVKCHKFIDTYLGGEDPREKILDDMMDVLNSLEEPATLPPGFNRIGDMTSPRAFHCAVRLEDGRVLLAGGFGPNRTPLNTAEVYDPATRTFSQTGSMASGRGRPGCALLEDGRVLVAGGEVARFVYTSSAEVYDPVTGRFTAVGHMTTWRGEGWHAFAVPGGALLFAGTFEGIFGTGTTAVDRFDIGNNTFSRVGTLLGGRRDYTAQVLADGSVFLVGGVLNFNTQVSPIAERYNTSTNQAQQTGQPNGRPLTRSWESALLPGGNVLVVTGRGLPAEVYSPGTNSFSLLSGSPAFYSGDFGETAVLPDGRVLLLGYGRSPDDEGRIAEMFEPGTGTFTALGSLAVPSLCVGYVATPLLDGTVLITGGGLPPSCDGAPLAEIFVPGGRSVGEGDALLVLDRFFDRLLVVDPVTGQSRSLMLLSHEFLSGLAADRDSGLVYSVDADTNELVMIDLRAGTEQSVGPVGISNVQDLTFGPDGALFGVVTGAGSNSQLVRIDTLTGQAAPVGGIVGGQFSGLVYDGDVDRMYATKSFANGLFDVSPSGTFTLLTSGLGAGIVQMADIPGSTEVFAVSNTSAGGASLVGRLDPAAPVFSLFARFSPVRSISGIDIVATEDVEIPANQHAVVGLLDPQTPHVIADQSIPLLWMDEDLDDDAAVSLAYSTNPSCAAAVLIVSGMSEDDEHDLYTWTTASVPEGQYYIQATITDGVNQEASDCSRWTVTVEHSAAP